MEGGTDRGGPTPARVDRRQEQYGDLRATPPPTTTRRGEGQARPTDPPSATHARGDRVGLTARQQQPPTDLQRHAYSLYRQCVAAGQWARFSVENRPDGQHISFACKPMAAAAAAACAAEGAARRRRPNQRRKEKKQLWLRSRQQQSLQAGVAAAADLGSYAHVAARAAPKRGAAAAAAPTVPAAPTATAAVAAPSCSPASPPSPMLTRARKRKKFYSPGAASAVVQLDGAEQTPPSSPPEPLSPVPPPLPIDVGSPSAPTSPPTPPPPWHVGSPSAPTSPHTPPPPQHSVSKPSALTEPNAARPSATASTEGARPSAAHSAVRPSASASPEGARPSAAHSAVRPSASASNPDTCLQPSAWLNCSPSAQSILPISPISYTMKLRLPASLDSQQTSVSSLQCSPLDGGAANPPPTPLWLTKLPPHLSICMLCRAACHGQNFNSCHSCYNKRTNK